MTAVPKMTTVILGWLLQKTLQIHCIVTAVAKDPIVIVASVAIQYNGLSKAW